MVLRVCIKLGRSHMIFGKEIFRDRNPKEVHPVVENRHPSFSGNQQSVLVFELGGERR